MFGDTPFGALPKRSEGFALLLHKFGSIGPPQCVCVCGRGGGHFRVPSSGLPWGVSSSRPWNVMMPSDLCPGGSASRGGGPSSLALVSC